MIILLLLLALFGFTFAGASSSSSGSGTATRVPAPRVQSVTGSAKDCASRPGARAASGQSGSSRACRPYVPVQP